MTRSTPSARAPVERGAHVAGAVADDRHVREVDAQLGQAVGEPGAVAVADAAAEHLGAGDDDRRARAHPQCGAWLAVSGGCGRRA